MRPVLLILCSSSYSAVRLLRKLIPTPLVEPFSVLPPELSLRHFGLEALRHGEDGLVWVRLLPPGDDGQHRVETHIVRQLDRAHRVPCGPAARRLEQFRANTARARGTYCVDPTQASCCTRLERPRSRIL
eukprot:scaffold9918_cov123-Isochrysis_galbana.AAC.7